MNGKSKLLLLVVVLACGLMLLLAGFSHGFGVTRGSVRGEDGCGTDGMFLKKAALNVVGTAFADNDEESGENEEVEGEDDEDDDEKEAESEEKEDEEENGEERVWSFDEERTGTVPQGWETAETAGHGTPAVWKVIADKTAPSPPNVVAVTKTENYGSTFNLLIARDTSYKDLEISVRVKAGTGEEDQGGGPIWRVRDADNYYIARWNPLEDNFRVYFVKNGRRRQLGSANVKADPAVWHEIEIRHEGNRIEAEFDGKKLIEVEDSTFTEAGMVGLWTKADAATSFDDLEVEEED